jgi:hypothetical protein
VQRHESERDHSVLSEFRVREQPARATFDFSQAITMYA